MVLIFHFKCTANCFNLDQSKNLSSGNGLIGLMNIHFQENAHFSICEALIAAIEQMKWNHVIEPKDTLRNEEEEEESDEEIKQLQQRIRIRKRERLKEVQYLHKLISSGIQRMI